MAIDYSRLGAPPFASGATAEPFTLGYRPELDGLRAVAVLAVLLFHAGVPVMRGGYIGVDLFFVLSGFLITTILCAELRRTGRASLRNFYMRRVLRLLPALVLLLLVYTLAVIAFAPAPRLLLEDALITLLYLSNWSRAFFVTRPDYLGHTWSLAIEEQFYLLWPLLLLFLVRRVSPLTLLRILLGGAAAALALRAALLFSGASSFRVYNGLDTRADALLLGCAVGFGLSFGLLRAELPRPWRGGLWFIAAVGLGLFAVLAPWDAPLMLTLGYGLVALLGGLVLMLCLSGPQDAPARVLRWPALVWVGRRSYGLYLWHFPIMRVLMLWDNSWPLVAVGGVALSLLAAGLSYAVIERPFLAMKGAFSAAPAVREGHQ